MALSAPRQTDRGPRDQPPSHPSDPHLTLTTLGALTVAHREARPDARPDARTPAPPRTLGPGKPTALLAYLACAPARTAAREQLTTLLWGDREPEPARHALRQTLWHLRRQLGADPFAAGAADALTLAPHLRVDRDAFLAALDRDEPEAAVAAYAGEFCPVVALPGGLAFEQWADGERQRLRALFTAAAERVARRHLDAGRTRDAVALARRVREADPHAQGGWRLLVEALVAARDPLLGAELEDLERAAAADDVTPEPATRALFAAARRVAAGQGRPSAEDAGGDTSSDGAAAGRLVAELVGREREFGTLVRAWDAVRERRAGRHLHVVAPAGMGKTRLLADVHARLRGARARVVAARAVLAERDAPLAFAAAVVRALVPLRGAAGVSPAAASALVALTPAASTWLAAAPSTATGHDAERQTADAVAELLAALTAEQPLALLLDDWHWADDASVRVLARVLARMDGMPLLAVTAARRAAAAPVPASAEPFGEPVPLPPLGPEALGALLASLGTLSDAPWAAALPAALFDATGGSPLLALQALRAALDHGVLALADRAWRCPSPDALRALLAAGGPIDARVADLAPDARALLLLLATAEGPLPLGVLDAAAADAPHADAGSVRELVAALERRGLAARETRAGASDAAAAVAHVAVAHDEIAAAARDGADPTDLRRAHERLALAWHGRAVHAAHDGNTSPDVDVLRRVAHHALRAADPAAPSAPDAPLGRVTASTFRHYLRARRAAGDRGTLREVARELVGHGTDAATVARLVRALPWRTRAAARARGTAGVALFGLTVAAAAVAGTLGFRAAPAPDAELLLLQSIGPDRGQGWLVPLRLDDWPDAPVELDDGMARAARRAHAGVAAYGTAAPNRVTAGPGGDWLVTKVYGDSGDTDVARWSQSGALERLTASRHDDGPEDVSPDGRTAVIATGRHDPRRATDLALLTLATGEVRLLTRTDHLDRSARWSPDGTRIAFARLPFAQPGRPAVCWVPPNGGAPRCHEPSSLDVMTVLAWEDRRHVLIEASERAAPGDSARGASAHERVLGRVLARVNVDDGSTAVLDRGGQSYDASPDGRLASCVCEPPGYQGASLFVFPAARPAAKRAVVRGGLRVDAPRQRVWRVPRRTERTLRAVTVVAPAELPVGAPMRLRAVAYDDRGDAAPVDHVEWRALTPDVATVDSSGLATGLRTGEARFAASAGGWRADTVRVPVRPAAARTLLDDAFPTAAGSSWRAFGAPAPSVVVHEARRAFWLGGDGNFANGVYTTRIFDGRTGLVLDVEVSIPVTRIQWQSLNVALAAIDTAALNRWDGVTGGPPTEGTAARTCGWVYPAGEGAGRDTRSLAHAGAREAPLDVPPAFGSGAWHRVRLALRPDGRCAVAVDDGPPVLLESRVPLDQPFVVWIAGQSAHTRVSVGRVHLAAGVSGATRDPAGRR